MMRRVLLLAFALLVFACGWHPRGALQLPPELQQLRVVSASGNNEFDKQLYRALRQAGIQIDTGARGYTLQIGPEQERIRNVALDRSARSAEQEVRFFIDYYLSDPDGAIVFGPRQLNASRIYAYDPNQVIAKEDEERIIYQELRDNMVGQLMRQIGRMKLRKPASTPAPATAPAKP
jgi:LPS-assembly lipoprotein